VSNEKICTHCGRQLPVSSFSAGQGACKGCRASDMRDRRHAARHDEEAEYRAELERLAERVRVETARIEKGLAADYSDLDWFDGMQVRLAVHELHENPGAPRYVSGLARFVNGR
jgi:hypothetical protein